MTLIRSRSYFFKNKINVSKVNDFSLYLCYFLPTNSSLIFLSLILSFIIFPFL